MLKYFNGKENKVACWVNPREFGAHTQSLVFIHGSGSSSSAWSHQYSKLHKNYNIVAINLPGHGKSCGRGEQDIAQYALCVKEILSILKLEHPILIGHSLGAAIALCFAANHPQNLSGVISIGGGLTMPVNPEMLTGLHSHPDVVLDLICKISLAKENRQKYFNALRTSLTQSSIDILSSDLLACSKFDLTLTAEKISVPVLAICGAEDKMTPPAASHQIAEAIAGATLLLIDGAGHMVMMEKPAVLNQAISNFAAALPQAVHSK